MSRRRATAEGPPSLVLATRNSGKVAEFTELLSSTGLTLLSLREFPDAPDVAEHACSYLENARVKALSAARYTGHAALGDDSGLEVDALGGRPGVFSARFAGEPADSRGNLELLLEQLRGVPAGSRTARFRCVLVVALPEDETLEAEGSCEGTIAFSPAGEGGFGYDPVFFIPAVGCTFGELSSAEKHRLSHRGRACAALRPRLWSFITG